MLSRNIAWASFDQGLSSLSNLLLSVLVARVAVPAEFGAFAIAFTIYQFGLGTSRAFIGEATLIRSSSSAVQEDALKGVLGASLSVGFLGSGINAGIAIFAGGYAGIFITMAVGFPILMVLDAARYWEFARRHAPVAVIYDSTWLAAQLSLYFAGLLVLADGAVLVCVAWIGGAAVATVVALVCRRCYPSPREGVAWVSANRDLSVRFFIDYLAVSGVQQSVVYASVVFSGIAAAGAIRGGQVVLGPLSTVTMGVAVVALPALAARARASDKMGILRASAWVSGSLAAVTGAYGVLLLLVPYQWGAALLGASWTAGVALVPLLLAQIAISNLSYGAVAGLRAMEAARLALWLRLSTVPIVLVLIVIGASTIGPAGAIAGATIGAAVQLIGWWAALVVVSRRQTVSHTEGKRRENIRVHS